MKKQILAAVLVMSGAAMPAHAGFEPQVLGKFKLPGLGKTDATSSAAPAGAPSGDALVTSFVTSQTLVMTAQATLGAALGLKDELNELQAQQKRLSSGQNDTDALKKSREYSEAASVAIKAKLDSQPQLTAEQRATFAKGLVTYAEALLGARNLLLSAQQYAGSLGANPMALMGKARAALWVGKETPGYVKQLGMSSKQLFDYARRNNIKTPANATAALDGL